MIERALAEDIFLVRSDTRYALASTFLRFEEHYESSRFRDRVVATPDRGAWSTRTLGCLRRKLRAIYRRHVRELAI